MMASQANVNGDAGSVEDVELIYFRRCTDRLLSGSTSMSKKLDLLKRLRQVKVNMEVLAASGIGKAVNACRDGSRSELDSLATELVANWKRAVDSALTRKPELLASPLAVAAASHSQAPGAAAQVRGDDSEAAGGSSSKQSADHRKRSDSELANEVKKPVASDSMNLVNSGNSKKREASDSKKLSNFEDSKKRDASDSKKLYNFEDSKKRDASDSKKLQNVDDSKKRDVSDPMNLQNFDDSKKRDASDSKKLSSLEDPKKQDASDSKKLQNVDDSKKRDAFDSKKLQNVDYSKKRDAFDSKKLQKVDDSKKRDVSDSKQRSDPDVLDGSRKRKDSEKVGGKSEKHDDLSKKRNDADHSKQLNDTVGSPASSSAKRVSFSLPAASEPTDPEHKKKRKKHKKHKRQKEESGDASGGQAAAKELLTAGEFDNSTGLTFEDCLNLATAQQQQHQKRQQQKKKEEKKRKKLEEQRQQQQLASDDDMLPALPTELDPGVSEAPVLRQTAASTAGGPEEDLAMPLKFSSRTAVYSGKARHSAGVGVYQRVPTLRQACLDFLAVHIDWLGALGPGVPYHVIKPVLHRCTVDQLLRLEALNPHLLGEDDELWEVHHARDFADQKDHADNDDGDDGDDNSRSGDGGTRWRRRYLSAMRRQQAKLCSFAKRVADSREAARRQQRQTKMTLIDRPPQRKRHFVVESAPSGNAATTVKFASAAKQARREANPERAQLVEQLSSHILPTAGAPLSVAASPAGGLSTTKTGGGGSRKSGPAPLMSKTLRQMQRLKASGYRV